MNIKMRTRHGDLRKAVSGLMNPGGGEHLVSHGFVSLDRMAATRIAYGAIAAAVLAEYNKIGGPATLPPAVRDAVAAFRKAEKEGGAK